jgi:hypothetical protein
MGYTVTIHAIQGKPDGIRTIEKAGWTGVGILCPRNELSNIKNYQDKLPLDKPGVYFLIGPSDTSNSTKVYIGEGDPFFNRVLSHHQSKEFWNVFIAFTTKDTSINKADIQYFESELVKIIKQNSNNDLDSDNKNNPLAPTLSWAQIDNNSQFVKEIIDCLPMVGYSIFKEKVATTSESPLVLRLNSVGSDASAQLTSNGILVSKGSIARKELQESFRGSYLELREELITKGILVEESDKMIFKDDFEFNSPSAAAAVILGRQANGLTNWKIEFSNVTLKEHQEKESEKIKKELDDPHF